MRRWLESVVLLLATGPAWGQEAQPVSATFTWNSLDLSTVTMADGQEAYALESVVTYSPDTEGPLAGLSGRCIVSGVRDLAPGRYTGSGLCVLTDQVGDRLVKRFTEGAETANVLATGEGAWDGGTGKFAGVAGEFTFGLIS